MSVDYKKEFFDREYTAREAYARIWPYVRKYIFRIVVGIVCGMLTAGTLVPIFSVVQPALEKVSRTERLKFMDELSAEEGAAAKADAPAEVRQEAQKPAARKNRYEREMEEAAKMPSWYPKAKAIADKVGIPLEDDEGAMGGMLVLMAVIGIPLVAVARLLLIYLNQYCLTWAATHADRKSVV